MSESKVSQQIFYDSIERDFTSRNKNKHLPIEDVRVSIVPRPPHLLDAHDVVPEL